MILIVKRRQRATFACRDETLQYRGAMRVELAGNGSPIYVFNLHGHESSLPRAMALVIPNLAGARAPMDLSALALAANALDIALHAFDIIRMQHQSAVGETLDMAGLIQVDVVGELDGDLGGTHLFGVLLG